MKAFGFALITLLATSNEAQPAQQPYEWVRALRALQDRVVSGDRNAHRLQRKLVARIATEFYKADIEAWKQPRNARAVAIYVMSGGNPKVLRDILKWSKLEAVDERVVKGALAYGEGHREIARKLLDETNPMTLTAGIGGHVALVRAILIEKTAPSDAIKLLGEARLLMPGTLVEEAALRLQMFIVSRLGQLHKFEALAEQYFRRFRRSLYAGGVQRRFAIEIVRHNYRQNPDRFERLDSILANIPQQPRRKIYLEIAQRSVFEVQNELAVFTARRALDMAPEGSRDKARAEMYLAAAGLVADDPNQAAVKLASIDVTKLGLRDTELLQVVELAAREIRRWPDSQPTPSEAPVKSELSPTLVELANLTEKLISKTSEILKEGSSK